MKTGLVVLLLCFSTFIQAQDKVQPQNKVYPRAFTKGMWLVGLQAGHSPAEFLGKNLTTHLYGGYFIANKLLVGLQASRIQEGLTSPIKDLSYVAGPIIRYQLTATRISPFVIASCQVGQRSLSQEQGVSSTNIFITGPGSQVVYSRSAAAGVSVGVVPSLRVDAVISWQDRVSTIGADFTSLSALYQAQIGINYSLGRAYLANRK